jgi:hypothetical protein
VLLTPLGQRFLDLDVNGRKVLFNQQLRTISTFQFIIRLLQDAKDGQLSQDVVQEELSMRLPTEDFEKLFETAVGWGRFGELLGYAPDTGMLYLDQPAAETSAPPP